MRFKRSIGMVGIGALLGSVLFAVPTAAFADDQGLDVDSAVSAVESVAPESLDNVAPTTSTADDAALYSTEDGTVSVPRAAEDDAVISGVDRELRITLPFADQASEGVTADSGVTAFDNGNASTTLPVVHDDGSLQILTVIESNEAPSRYDYTISVPDGGAMTVAEGGVVLITDSTGNFVGGVAPAWAKDATDTAVPTHYEVDGTTLTQVVEHTADTQYPVVADPWAGIRLFTGFNRDIYHGDYRYSGWVTILGAVILSGGGGVGGYLAGQAVFRGAGWDEWKAKWPAITNKATLQQQYNCHVSASVYGLPFTQDYNLERFRPNRANWVDGIANHRCNWT